MLSEGQLVALAKKTQVEGAGYCLSLGFDEKEGVLCALFRDSAVVVYFQVEREDGEGLVALAKEGRVGKEVFGLARRRGWAYKKIQL